MMARLTRGVGANLYGAAVTLVVQAACVPVFLALWGSARYGQWLVLAALPTALSFADCGLTATAANRMTMMAARGERSEAAATFRTTGRFLAWTTASLATPAALFLATCPGRWLATTVVSSGECRVTLAAVTAVVLAGLQTSYLSAGFRANGDYAVGLVATDTIRLTESLASLAAASLGGDLAGAALALAVVRIGGVAGMTILLRSRVPWLACQVAMPVRRPVIDRHALAVLSIPAAFAVSLQGTTLMAGFALPFGAVAVFGVTRTMTRMVVQVLGLVNHALMPEMSMAAGRHDAAAMRSIMRLNRLACAFALVPAWIGLMLLGPDVLRLWGRQTIAADPIFVGLMATAALCHGLWLSSANLLLALNRQAEYAYWFLAVSVAGMLTALPLAVSYGLRGMAAASLAAELAMMAFVLPKLNSLRPDAADLSLQGA